MDADGETAFTLQCGDIVSIHGQTGEVYFGARDIVSVTAADPLPQDG